MGPANEIEQRHRANYILEQGTWRATCRVCGYFVTDPLRRRAASLFRAHIRDAAEAAELIDLRGEIGTESDHIRI